MSLASPQRVASFAADLSWDIYPGNYCVFAARRNSTQPIYGSGYGLEGAFGINTAVVYDSPQVINFVGDLATKTMNDIKDIECSQVTIVILNDVSGSTYTMGNNNYGQIGNGTFANSLAPFKLNDLSGYTAEKSSAGVTHTLILCRNRTTPTNVVVRFIGSSIYGESGLGTTGYVYVVPTLMNISGMNVSLMSAGLFFSVLYDASANILRTCGRNNRGQLGDATTTNRVVLTDVSWGSTAPSRLTKIVSGYSHSLALDSSGNIWSWGLNNAGQLGRYTANTVINRITNVPGGTIFTDIAAGSITSFAITSSGELYAWGENETALIGDRSLRFFNADPIKIQGIPPVKNVYASTESSYFTTTTGEIYSFGRNHYGEAMRESPEYKPTYINPEPSDAPRSIPLLKTQVPI